MNNVKNKFKKVLALVCCLVLGVTALSVFGLPTAAEGEYFVMTESNRNIFVNVDQKIELVDVAVTINGVSMSGKDVASWTSTSPEVSVVGGILQVSAAGKYTVTVADANNNTATVTVHAKNPTDTEWVIYEEDFESVAEGTLPEGWTIAKNADVAADEVTGLATVPTYVSQPMVKDGKLWIGNGVNTAYTYVWLPEFIDSYGDYSVEADIQQTWAYNNIRIGGLVLRGDRTENTGAHPSGGYRIMVRRASTGADGILMTSLARIDNAANTVKAALPFYMGSTRNWGRPDWTDQNPWYKPATAGTTDADWKSEGYQVMLIGTASGDTVKFDAYRNGEQEQFQGDMGPGGNGGWWETHWLADDANLAGAELEADTSAWDASVKRETGAVGLITTGVQMAVESIRVVVKAKDLAGNPDAYIPTSEQEAAKNTEYTAQKFGVISDIHIQDAATDGDYNLKAMLTKFKNDGVAAVLMTGDVVNTGLTSQYEKVMGIWNSVFTDPATAPELLAIMGNHEFEQAYYNRETVEDAYQNYMDAYGYDEVNFHKVIGGVHIIGINSETAAVHGGYTLDSVAFLEEELAAAAEADPYAPIIVMCHQTLAGTTYGSGWGSDNTGSLYDILKPYQQVIYLAGHSHFPTENERSIMQKDFTTVDLPSLQYTSVETKADGTGSVVAPNAFDSQGGMMITINADAKQMELQRLKISGKQTAASVVDLKDPWIIKLPTFKREFAYTANRAEFREAPVFDAEAAVSVGDIDTDSCIITFPAASHDDFVHGYNIVVTEAGGTEVLLNKYVVADFYTGIDAMAEEVSVELEALPSNTDIVIEVTAMESFGKTSAPITGEATTDPIDTPSAGYNMADFFDVNLSVDWNDNSPYRRTASGVYNKAHPTKLVFDEELNRQVAYMAGWMNYPVSQGQLKKITEAFTIEVSFKTPAEAITAGQCIFGNPESGGVTVEFNGAGEFQVGASIKPAEGNAAYKYINAGALAADTWYHAVYTFDGEKSVLYLNGVKVGEVESVGTVNFNPSVNYLTIGANVNGTGNAAYVFMGHVAAARVWTEACEATDAPMLYEMFQKDDLLNALYQKALNLYYLTTENEVTEAEAEAAYEMLAKIDETYFAENLTAAQAEEVIAEASALLAELAPKYDMTKQWTEYRDSFYDWSKLYDRSEGWQWDYTNKASMKVYMLNKLQNTDTHVIYKVPGGYVRNIEFDAYSVATEYDFEADFNIFVSEDGVEWREVSYKFTEPVANQYNDYWVQSVVSSKGAIGGEYQYVKIELNQFGKNADGGDRATWSTALVDVRIAYSADADDIEMDESVFADYVAPQEPPKDDPSDPEAPDTGDVTVLPALLLALACGAAFVVLTSKKRVNN